jgi:hypothetical protein
LGQATRGIDKAKAEADKRIESLKMEADARLSSVETDAKKRIDIIRRENEDKVLRLEAGLTQAKNRADPAFLIRSKIASNSASLTWRLSNEVSWSKSRVSVSLTRTGANGHFLAR